MGDSHIIPRATCVFCFCSSSVMIEAIILLCCCSVMVRFYCEIWCQRQKEWDLTTDGALTDDDVLPIWFDLTDWLWTRAVFNLDGRCLANPTRTDRSLDWVLTVMSCQSPWNDRSLDLVLLPIVFSTSISTPMVPPVELKSCGSPKVMRWNPSGNGVTHPIHI